MTKVAFRQMTIKIPIRSPRFFLGSNLLTPLPAAGLYQIAENRSEFALHLQNGFDGHGLTGKIRKRTLVYNRLDISTVLRYTGI